MKRSCELVRSGEMPMPQYVWMHPEARLSARDIDALCGAFSRSAVPN